MAYTSFESKETENCFVTFGATGVGDMQETVVPRAAVFHHPRKTTGGSSPPPPPSRARVNEALQCLMTDTWLCHCFKGLRHFQHCLSRDWSVGTVSDSPWLTADFCLRWRFCQERVGGLDLHTDTDCKKGEEPLDDNGAEVYPLSSVANTPRGSFRGDAKVWGQRRHQSLTTMGWRRSGGLGRVRLWRAEARIWTWVGLRQIKGPSNHV